MMMVMLFSLRAIKLLAQIATMTRAGGCRGEHIRLVLWLSHDCKK